MDPFRVVVIQHAELEGLGTFGPLLNARCQVETLRAFAGDEVYRRQVDALLRAPDIDALVVLGGPDSAAGRERPPRLDQSLRLLHKAVRDDIPVLGICLGAQLLAWTLGAGVWAGRTRGKEKEIGWYQVSLAPRGLVDPAFHGFNPVDPVFHWHGDSFDLPAGAWRLAETPLYRNQAFRWGRWAYGLQFHLEVTGQMVSDWVDAGAEELASLKRADPDLIVSRAARLVPLLKPKAETFISFFLDCIERRRTEEEALPEPAGSSAEASSLSGRPETASPVAEAGAGAEPARVDYSAV